MRLLLPIILLAALLVSCSKSVVPVMDTTPVAVTIHMVSGAFNPKTVSIKQGQKVCWANDDTEARWPASNVHPTHELYPEFDPKNPVRPGETWCFVFTKVGHWVFHDHLFPELLGMVNVD